MIGARRSVLLAAAPLLFAALLCTGCGAASHPAAKGTIVVVAAENEYGSMVQAIGGNRVTVTSLLDNPNTDPHEFEASASTAQTLSAASLVIKNGLGYDSWLDKLLGASPRSGRIVFSVGEYLGHHTGDNPHVWYFPPGWARAADIIAADLGKLDPGHRRYFAQRKTAWLASLRPIAAAIAAVRKLTAGHTVIATEPVYGYMLAALGATSLDAAFQKSIMDGTDPSPQSVAQFETALQQRAVHMLFYNSQVTDPTTTRMRDIAAQYHVPVVGVTETQPPNLSFAAWQLSQLRAIQRSWK